MRTECNPKPFEFAPVEGRQVVAAFDGGAITSNAGALLLGGTDRAIRLTERFAFCFTDLRRPELVEHGVGTMVIRRVVGIQQFSFWLDRRIGVSKSAPLMVRGLSGQRR